MHVERYLRDLEAALRTGHGDADVLEELRAHLEDAARDLQLAGHAPEESERAAIHRVGAPAEIAAALATRRAPRGRAPRPLAMMLAVAISAILLSFGGGIVAAAYTPRVPAERNITHVQTHSRGMGLHHRNHCAALPGAAHCR